MWLHTEYPATENTWALVGEKKKFLKAEEEPDVLSSKVDQLTLSYARPPGGNAE